MKKFDIRDLVNAGVFSILVLMATWCAGMVGYLPILMPLVPFSCCLFSGPVFMLYSTRINKFGMVLIMGILFASVFSLSGHGAIVFPFTIVVALLAELVIKKGNYKSVKYARLSYVVFSLFAAANLLPLYIAREAYLQKMVEKGYSKEFMEKLYSFMPNWSFLPVVALGMLGAYLGCTIGIKILKKHFEKAGMIK